MKKNILFIVATLFMSCTLFSCSNNDDTIPTQEQAQLQFEINVSTPSLSRAARKSWVKNDKIILYFYKEVMGSNQCYIEDKYQAQIVYDGSKWNFTMTDAALVDKLKEMASGNISAIYADSPHFSMKFNGTYAACENADKYHNAVRMTTTNVDENKSSFIIEGNTLKADIKMSYPGEFVEITIKGIDNSWKFYADDTKNNVSTFPIVPFERIGASFIDNNGNIRRYSSSDVDMSDPIELLNCEEGAHCYSNINTFNYEECENYTFHLIDSNNQHYKKSFTGYKIVPPIEIAFQGPVEGNLNGWEKEEMAE